MKRPIEIFILILIFQVLCVFIYFFPTYVSINRDNFLLSYLPIVNMIKYKFLF